MDDFQRSVLAHVVVDPDAWYAHAVEEFGARAEFALAEKIRRWRRSYENAAAQPDYKTRAERG